MIYLGSKEILSAACHLFRGAGLAQPFIFSVIFSVIWIEFYPPTKPLSSVSVFG